MNDRVDAKMEGAGGDMPDARGEHRLRTSVTGRSVPSIQESDFVADRYKMDHAERGIAVIFNNKNFHPKTDMGMRNGTDVDCASVYELLKQMKFQDVRVCTDYTTNEMRRELHEVSKEDHTNNDCFVCVILTHGEEGYVFGVDDKIALEELVTPFKGHKCPSLAGKPKIFFIQACRGSKLDAGVEVADAIGEEAMDEDEVVMRTIPTEADFLMAYSVVPGYFAWRNSTNGSWFIQAVCKVFGQFWNKLDILTMMTRVNKKVAYDFKSNASKENMTNKKQIPCVTSMLTKDVYFQ